ncbi:ubiquitin-specific protease ubp1 [Dispira parvispora]|uniref:Ubiquitin carboxyl-terminal hydrolase n=1 Tax=Dispira parvispora TaxID=1520584 RepID=A0A9W8AUK2_9FUNG|nr:ubiquitin-specific protease ubp1 [Dispira parvispora]
MSYPILPFGLSTAIVFQGLAWCLVLVGVALIVFDSYGYAGPFAFTAPRHTLLRIVWQLWRRELRVRWYYFCDYRTWWTLARFITHRTVLLFTGAPLAWVKPRYLHSFTHFIEQMVEPCDSTGLGVLHPLPSSGLTGRRRLSAAGNPPELVLGLVNVGNSCFLNSVLQALASSQYLPEYLSQLLDVLSDHNGRMADEDHWVSLPVTEALEETLVELNQTVSKNAAFRPFAILAALAGNRRMINREQQDAHEAFQLISTALQDEDQSLRFTVPSLLSIRTIGPLVRQTVDPSILLPRRPTTNPFLGLLASRLSCMQCGYTAAIRHFSFTGLSLALPFDYVCSLEQCLRAYMTMEILEDARCQRCTLRTTLQSCRRALAEAEKRTTPPPTSANPETSTSNRTDRSAGKSFENTGSDTDTEGEIDSDASTSNDLYSLALLRAQVNMLETALQQQDYDLAHTKDTMYSQQSNPHTTESGSTVVASPLDISSEEVFAIRLQSTESPHSTKQSMVAKPPRTLCLHLSRTTVGMYGQTIKNNCQVVFPEYLDMTSFTTGSVLQTQPNEPISIPDINRTVNSGDAPPPPLSTGVGRASPNQPTSESGQGSTQSEVPPVGSYWYRLQAVVVHFGTHSYGHFITFRRRTKSPSTETTPIATSDFTSSPGIPDVMRSEWYKISDEQVERATLDQVLHANPYLLLYEQVSDQTLIRYLTKHQSQKSSQITARNTFPSVGSELSSMDECHQYEVGSCTLDGNDDSFSRVPPVQVPPSRAEDLPFHSPVGETAADYRYSVEVSSLGVELPTPELEVAHRQKFTYDADSDPE